MRLESQSVKQSTKTGACARATRAPASSRGASTVVHPAPRRAFFELREDRVRAGKSAGTRAAFAAALLDRPFQRALDRRRLKVEIVAIEAKPGFQPQTVPRPEPDRQDRFIGEQFPGKTFSRFRRH